jgi:hypothetical protein
MRSWRILARGRAGVQVSVNLRLSLYVFHTVHGIAARDASLGYGGTMADRLAQSDGPSLCTRFIVADSWRAWHGA